MTVEKPGGNPGGLTSATAPAAAPLLLMVIGDVNGEMKRKGRGDGAEGDTALPSANKSQERTHSQGEQDTIQQTHDEMAKS